MKKADIKVGDEYAAWRGEERGYTRARRVRVLEIVKQVTRNRGWTTIKKYPCCGSTEGWYAIVEFLDAEGNVDESQLTGSPWYYTSALGMKRLGIPTRDIRRPWSEQEVVNERRRLRDEAQARKMEQTNARNEAIIEAYAKHGVKVTINYPYTAVALSIEDALRLLAKLDAKE